jgi:GDP-L-fucose synthase
LFDLIAKLIDFKGEIIGDASKPNGQPRRMLDTKRAEKEFGFRVKVDFREGLKRTIDWYLSTRKTK